MKQITYAAPVEILRSVEKDDLFTSYLKAKLAEIIQSSFGTSLWLKYHKLLETLTDFSYYLSTSLCRKQTLGEEYIGLLLFDRSGSTLPSFIKIFFMVISQSFSSILNVKGIEVLNKFYANICSPDIDDFVRRRRALVKELLKNAPSLIFQLHLVMFYFQRNYFHIAKRFTTIRYITLHNSRSGKNYENFMSVIAYVQLLSLIFNVLKIFKTEKDDHSVKMSNLETETSGENCPLCLNEIKYASATPCGHVMCWKCCHACVSNDGLCPVCRNPILRHQIIPILNYL